MPHKKIDRKKSASSNQKGLAIWLTGLPCSGKTTLAREIEKYLSKKKLRITLLDGNNFRKKHVKKLGFTREDRNKNIRKAAHETNRLARQGINVVAAFISPYREMRDYARRICPNFIEIYVKCDVKECIKRDTRGLYKRALAGEIENFTGISDPYEEPTKPEIILETNKMSIEESSRRIIYFLEKWCE